MSAELRSVGEDEEDGQADDGNDFFQLMTTTGQIVEVDPALNDGVLLTNRLPRNRVPSFWDRARSVFSSSVLTQPEVAALRDGEAAPPQGQDGGRAFKASLLLGLPPALGSEGGGEQDGEPSGALATPHVLSSAGSPRMSEEKIFSQEMDAEWQKYLDEEILLLRIERVNDMLEEGKKHEGKAAGGGGGGRTDKLPRSPWGNPGTVPQRSRSASAAPPLQQPASSPPPKPRSVRQRFSAARTSSLSPSSSNPSPVAATTVQLPGGPKSPVAPAPKLQPMLSMPGGGHVPPPPPPAIVLTVTPPPLARTTSSPARAPGRPPKLMVPGDDASARAVTKPRRSGVYEPLAVSKLAASERKPRNPVSPPEEVPHNWTPSREGSDGRNPRLIAPGMLGASLPGSGPLPRSNSGVKAAMAAAEAAATGGKRIRRVFESLRRMVHSHSKDDKAAKLPRGSALSTALRLGQISSSQRGAAWLAIACVDTEDNTTRSKYASLVKQESRVEREIERDMNRTFPYHQMFAVEKGAGQRKLFNVIKAYSVLDKDVGYTQGMGFVAATLLMNMGEEDAFCCLVFLMYRCGLRAVFLPNMEQLQVRLYQLSQLVLDCLPILHQYFESKDIKPVMYAADWFLTLFSRSLPIYVAHRVFDVVFAERTTAIVFKLGIVLLQVCRRQLLQCQEMENSIYFVKHHMPQQLKKLPDADKEELVAKALRVELPFESLLRLEAEYELLAEEAATAANEVQAAAAASEKAAASWESSRAAFEARLRHALEAQKKAEVRADAIQRQFSEHLKACHCAGGGLASSRAGGAGSSGATAGASGVGGPQAGVPNGLPLHDASSPTGMARVQQAPVDHDPHSQGRNPSPSSSSLSSIAATLTPAPTAGTYRLPPVFPPAGPSVFREEAVRQGIDPEQVGGRHELQHDGPGLVKVASAPCLLVELDVSSPDGEIDSNTLEAASTAQLNYGAAGYFPIREKRPLLSSGPV